MKKCIAIILFVTIFTGSFGLAIGNNCGPGPAPNSGDGIPDGSGFDPSGQNGTGSAGSGNGPSGPAPNSGDGVFRMEADSTAPVVRTVLRKPYRTESVRVRPKIPQGG